MGLWAASFFHICLRQVVKIEVDSLDRIDRITNKVSNAAAIVFAYVLLQIVLLEMFTKGFDPDPVWIENITLKCGSLGLEHGFTNQKYAYVGESALALGAYLGLLLKTKSFSKFRSDQVSTMRQALRVILTIVFFASLSIFR